MNLRRLFSKKPEGGIQHSIHLKRLSKIPLAHRDLDWDRAFMQHLGEAKLAAKIPQIGKGADGFSYFQLVIPDIGAPFQSYIASELIEQHLLQDGHGIQVFSYGDEPDRRFSYGELVNYHYRKEFRSNIQNWLPASSDQFTTFTDVIGGDPSESILPGLSRKVLLAYFVKNGFHFPKVSHLNIMTEDGIKNQLVFNLEPHMFKNPKHFDDILSSLKWFFPVHYTYSAVPEHYLENIFFNL